jgi:hypothetical protein
MDSSSPAPTPMMGAAERAGASSFAALLTPEEGTQLFSDVAGTLREYVLSGSATVEPPAYLGLHCGPGEMLKWQEVFDQVFALLADRVCTAITNVDEVNFTYGAPALAVPVVMLRSPKVAVSDKAVHTLLDAASTVLTKMKQKNPQVVMGTVRAVGYLLTAVTHRTASPGTLLAIKQCLVGLLQLLKTHGNKLVQECVATTLSTQINRYAAATADAGRPAVLFSLNYLARNNVLSELFTGAMTLQSIKVVMWLQGLVVAEMDLCLWLMLSRPRSSASSRPGSSCSTSGRPGSASPRGGDTSLGFSTTLEDVLGCMALCKLCVAHKDATVREAGLSLSGKLVAYTVLLYSFGHRSARSGLVGLAHESVSESSLSSVLVAISPGIEAAMTGMSQASKSNREKIVKYANAALARYAVATGTSRLPLPAAVGLAEGAPPVSPDKHLKGSAAVVQARASASASAACADAGAPKPAGVPNALADQWYEVKLSLRAPLPHSAAEWEACYMTLSQAGPFFQDLSDLATCLSEIQILGCGSAAGGPSLSRQYLFREFILAFDENTSSNDQSDSSGVSSHSVAMFEQFFGLDAPETADAAPLRRRLASLMQGAEGPRALLVRYRALAVGIRRLIRVKMADEADIKQVLSRFVPCLCGCRCSWSTRLLVP